MTWSASRQTDLGAAQHDLDVGPQRFQQAHDLGGFNDVPDVDAQANHGGLKRQQLFNNLLGPLLDDEFAQPRLRAQAGAAKQVHIGQQAAQTERGMDVFGVECGQNDGG
jgi:hypothetical protein